MSRKAAKKKPNRTLLKIRNTFKKGIGMLALCLVLVFIGYHLYSVGSLLKNIKKTAGISSSSTQTQK